MRGEHTIRNTWFVLGSSLKTPRTEPHSHSSAGFKGTCAAGTYLWPRWLWASAASLAVCTCSSALRKCARLGVGCAHYRMKRVLVRSRASSWVCCVGKKPRLLASRESSMGCPGPPRDKPALAVSRRRPPANRLYPVPPPSRIPLPSMFTEALLTTPRM